MDQMNFCKELWCKNLCLVQEDELGNFLRLLLNLFLVISCFYKLTTVFPGRVCGDKPWDPGGRFLVTMIVVFALV